MGQRKASVIALWLTVGLSSTSPVHAADSSAALDEARAAVSSVRGRIPELRASVRAALTSDWSVPKRISAGELHIRNGNLADAIDVLNQVVELHAQGAASEAEAADAEMLLAEAYFRDSQLLSAKRHYARILGRAAHPAYAGHAGRALARYVDVALRTRHDGLLQEALSFLGALSLTDEDGSLTYARGKLLYAVGRHDEALRTLRSLPGSSEFALQAGYLEGVVLMKIAEAQNAGEGRALDPRRFDAAIERFGVVAQTAADGEEEQQVVDLAWMAIGRLLYELGEYPAAAEAYSAVPQSSPEFSTMLYELAWVYARQGDHDRAQRALEVLSITHPEDLEFADGTLLRADLMLRSGRYEGALGLYRGVRRRFEPIRAGLAAFLERTTEPAAYYDELVADRLDESSSIHGLSPIVLGWARDQARDERGFALIDDISRSHLLVRQARRMAVQLRAALASPTRVKVFPETRRSYEQALILRNRLAQAVSRLLQGLDATVTATARGPLARLRREQSKLAAGAQRLPTTASDFARRAAEGESRWNRASQQLQRLSLEVDRLHAIINALHKVVADSQEHGVSISEAAKLRLQAQIAANERDVRLYRERIAVLRQTVELGLVQVGVGDPRLRAEAQLRGTLLAVAGESFRYAGAGHGGERAARYARDARPLLSEVATLSRGLDALLQEIEGQASERTGDVARQVEVESRSMQAYAEQLERLDDEGRLLVGELAMLAFVKVHERLKSVVLRADVGTVQEAWERREGRRARVRALQRERAREEHYLDEELREVLEDAEDGP